MTMKTIRQTAGLAAISAVFAGIALQPAAGQAAASMTVMSLQRRAPAGAVILFSGKESEARENWYQRLTTNPSPWKVDADGMVPASKHDITSKQEFGDIQLHLEFRSMLKPDGKVYGDGNSGIGFMGRYEVQICNSYGRPNGEDECGGFYGQIGPRVTAARKAGEWQTYDIVFRAPRLDASGALVSQPRATVYLNGILVMNNEEFKGPTGIQHRDFAGVAATGPIVLQGDHDPVQYRNVWVVRL